MRRMYGPSYIAGYLGVSLGSVYNWIRDAKSGFPKADVVIVGRGDVTVAQGWYYGSIHRMRPWYETRHNLTPPEADRRWSRVDAKLLAETKKDQEAKAAASAQREEKQRATDKTGKAPAAKARADAA